MVYLCIVGSYQQYVCEVAGAAAGSDSNPSTGKAASEGGSGLRSAVPQGAGPRIYVGGIPNAVSETMVRKYFSNWGKVRSPTQHLLGQRQHSTPYPTARTLT